MSNLSFRSWVKRRCKIKSQTFCRKANFYLQNNKSSYARRAENGRYRRRTWQSSGAISPRPSQGFRVPPWSSSAAACRDPLWLLVRPCAAPPSAVRPLSKNPLASSIAADLVQLDRFRCIGTAFGVRLHADASCECIEEMQRGWRLCIFRRVTLRMCRWLEPAG